MVAVGNVMTSVQACMHGHLHACTVYFVGCNVPWSVESSQYGIGKMHALPAYSKCSKFSQEISVNSMAQ